MRYNGKQIFFIYKHLDYQNINDFITRWNILAKKENLSDGFYFFTGLLSFDTLADAKQKGLDGGIIDINAQEKLIPSLWTRGIEFLKRKTKISFEKHPRTIDYYDLIKHAWSNDMLNRNDVIPMILPNCDHTPRSGKFGTVYVNTSPSSFEKMLKKILPLVNLKENKLIVLKSWNEWGEGNYMEPDIRFGQGFIKTLATQLNQY